MSSPSPHSPHHGAEIDSVSSTSAHSVSYRDEPESRAFSDAEDLESSPATTTSVEAFHDCDEYSELDDPDIPTIRLSNLGTAFEQDFQTVQNELGHALSSSTDEEDNRDRADSSASMELKKASPSNSNSNSQSKMILQEVVDGSSVSPTASEEIEMEEDHAFVVHQSSLNKPPPIRQRLVSSDGVIAEFDLPANDPYYNTRHYSRNTRSGNRIANSPNHDSSSGGGDGVITAMDDAKIVAEAVEIDESNRSLYSMHDLELGDEEPLPYPGTMARRGSNLARAARSAIAALTSTASSRSNSSTSASRSPFARSNAIGRYRRAELLSATIIKDAPTQYVGLNLLRDDVVVYSINRDVISAADDNVNDDNDNSISGDAETAKEANGEGSLLRNCPFQAGDKILSINNKRTEHMDSQEAARMLREATGFITIVCQNPDGDPCLIETMITKANKNQRSGMGLKSTGQQDLRVSSINENGLFASSLLNVGDRILSINEIDVTEVDARVACDIIRNATDRVTVVARTAHTTGVVVAEVSSRGMQRETSQQVLTVVHEDPNQRGNEIEDIDDHFQLSRQQREHLAMGICIMLVIVAVISGVFGSTASSGGGDDDNNDNNSNSTGT